MRNILLAQLLETTCFWRSWRSTWCDRTCTLPSFTTRPWITTFSAGVIVLYMSCSAAYTLSFRYVVSTSAHIS